MANPKKAQLHHGKAGDALKKGDHKAAAHHMGHALAALRTTSSEGPESADEMMTPDEMPEGETEGSAPPMIPAKGSPVSGKSLRDRLKGFRK